MITLMKFGALLLVGTLLDGRAQQPGGSLTPRFFLPALLQSAYCNIATQQFAPQPLSRTYQAPSNHS